MYHLTQSLSPSSSTTSSSAASSPASSKMSSSNSPRPVSILRSNSSSLTPSSTDSLHSMEPLSSSLPSNKSSCAFPSWPKRSLLHSLHCDQASSYISDADLFPSEPISQLSTFQNELSIQDIVAMRSVEEVPAATEVPALVPDGPSRSVTERLLALRDGSSSSKKTKSGKRRMSERKPRTRSGNMAPIQEAVE